ncbi:hypothetical protein UNDKW_5430 [Undibacterium sp. KW1]|uniref:type III toxin-antitoxin system TenpIN family toxin n=1 Tax=Undibacterium sp. KW1 TaxID=2058624 RepID=UPI001331E411|nr:hypothetical protein [Undibacterium sp. KW1]BBB63703.1 hypothetical protein UNDKW_5430 [Undibacterium sp. KW1]
MQLLKLDSTFYADHTHLVQVLDNIGGVWEAGKIRGYGIVLISIKNLTFGIPLRSNIRHKAAYLTKKNPSVGNAPPYGKGLDFSKALLISDPAYISTEVFKIPAEEHNKLVAKQPYIAQKFEKYVEKYISAVRKPDSNILNSIEYRHTTLQNYHAELEI